MASNAQLTPMMAQYRRIKSELPKDALLLFRLGDFYEMFFEDAQTGAQLLNVALTKRGVVPMCGIPFHAANAYIGRLLKAGRKVAICDQMEDARPGQLVKREVTQILSPGTHFDERMLKAERNNFLAAVYPAGQDVRAGVRGLDHRRFHDHGGGGGHGGADGAAAVAAGGADLPGGSGGGEGFAAGRESWGAGEPKPLNAGQRVSPCALGTGRTGTPGGAERDARCLGGYGVRLDPERLRRLGVRAGDGAVHGARAFQGRLAGWLRAEGPHGGHRRGGGGAALPDATSAARRGEPDAHFLLPTERLPGARLHDAAAPGNPGAAAPRRPAERVALRRAESHGHADGRAAAARLAVATAGHGRSRFGGGRRRCRRSWRMPPAWRNSARSLRRCGTWSGRSGG